MYPALAKLKSEVKYRKADNWFTQVDKDGDKIATVDELAANLKRILFNEARESFWTEL